MRYTCIYIYTDSYKIRYHIFQGRGGKTQPPPSTQCVQARQLQHTADMLEGVLYVDRLAPGAGVEIPKMVGTSKSREFLGSNTSQHCGENHNYGFSIMFLLDMRLLWVHPPWTNDGTESILTSKVWRPDPSDETRWKRSVKPKR